MKRVSANTKAKVIGSLMKTAAGRKKVASALQEPLKQLKDYVSTGRKAFIIDELAQGAEPVYDKDIDTVAYVVGEKGESIQTVIKGDRIRVPLFELTSLPTIPMTQVKERRFDVINRVKTKVKDELFREEDKLIFAAMSTAGINNTDNVPLSVAKASFGMDTLADELAKIESHDLTVKNIFMNPDVYPVFRKAGRDYIDPVTQRDLLRTGLVGMYSGCNIYRTSSVPSGTVYLVAEPEYFGVIPVKIDLTVLPADEPRKREFGWSVFEEIGIGIHNSKGISMISIT